MFDDLLAGGVDLIAGGVGEGVGVRVLEVDERLRSCLCVCS
jgi:hypothetical protein